MPNPLDSGVAGLDWSAPKPHHKTNRRTAPRPSWSACGAPGCTDTLGKRTTWGTYCARHAINARRWGHPLQVMVLPRELDPYLQIVKRIRERNAGTDWDAVYGRWRAVVAVARDYLGQVRSGHVHVGYRRQAAEIFTQIADTTEDARVVDLVLATFLFESFDRGRFKSDAAFRACLLHVIRREAKAGRSFSIKPGDRERATYKILGMKTRETAAAWLIEALGPVGLHVSRQEWARVKAEDATKDAFRAAVATIE